MGWFATVFATVKAETQEEAIEKAKTLDKKNAEKDYDKAQPSVCNYCSNHIEIGEHDDSVEIIAEEI